MSDPDSSQQEHQLFRESVRSFVDRDVAAFTIGAGTSEIMREIIAKSSRF